MNPGRLLVGLVLVALGIVLLLERLGVANAGWLIGALWPLVIVAAGVLQMAVTRRAHLGATITIVVGLVLLAATLNLLSASVWQFVWPVALIAVGLLFLAGMVSRGIFRQTEQRDDVAHALSVFGGQKVVSESQFRGASLTSFFGGDTLDLRQANLAPEGADVDVMTAFGGAGILVPEGWRVLLSGIPIFGGFDDKTSHQSPQGRPRAEGEGHSAVRGR